MNLGQGKVSENQGISFQTKNELPDLSRVSMRGSRGRQGSGSSLKNHKNIGFLKNTGPNHLKNHKAIKPAFNLRH